MLFGIIVSLKTFINLKEFIHVFVSYTISIDTFIFSIYQTFITKRLTLQYTM